MQAILPKIPPKAWKNLFFSFVLLFTGCELCYIGDNEVWAANLEAQENLDLTVSNITYFYDTKENQHSTDLQQISSQIQVATNTDDVKSFQQQGQSTNLAKETANTTEQLYQPEKIEIPLPNLQQQTQLPPESDVEQELGLRVRPKPVEGIPAVEFKPIGFLKAHVGYFQTSNIFSARDNPIEDGLVFSGLTLASAYLPVGSHTYLNGSIDGNLIRYLDQSKYSYNQLKLNFSIYQQLSQKMYGELGWSNQQLFYAQNGDFFNAGERFLNEHSLQLSLGRRDTLSQKLTLDSSYQLSVNFSEPESRSRVINSLGVSLNYSLQKPLQLGINYQVNLSDFTQQEREDQFHRLYANLNYSISDQSNVNLQSGINFGDSSVSNIDFNSWFFSVNYNFELGRF